MNSTWNVGSIGIGGPPLRGPSSTRLIGEPPLSPPVSAGSAPVASAQPLEPSAPAAPVSGTATTAPAWPEPTQRPATSLESLLMRFRLITSEQLDEALREKRETGKDVGAIVVERGWVNEDQLARLLSYAPAFQTPSEPAIETPAASVVPAIEREAEPAPAPEATAEPAHDWRAGGTAPATETAPESEPDAAAGPIVSTEPVAPARVEPVLDPIRPLVEEVPALELVEPEQPIQTAPAPSAEAGSFAPAWTSAVPAEPVAAEPAGEPSTTAQPVAAVADVAPIAEPALEIVAESEEPAATALPAPAGPVATDAQPEPRPTLPELTLEPVAKAEEPVVERVAEPVHPLATALPQPAPAQPVREPEPVSVAPAPEPVPVAAAPEPQTVRIVEPPAIETIARVFLRLSNGERVEAGSFDDIGAAKERAAQVVHDITEGQNGWPFVAGRYIRPEAIVSVDLDTTVVRYA